MVSLVMWEDAIEGPAMEPLIWDVRFGVGIRETTKTLLDILVVEAFMGQTDEHWLPGSGGSRRPVGHLSWKGPQEVPLLQTPLCARQQWWQTRLFSACQPSQEPKDWVSAHLTATYNAQLNTVLGVETGKWKASRHSEFLPFPGKILKNRVQYDMWVSVFTVEMKATGEVSGTIADIHCHKWPEKWFNGRGMTSAHDSNCGS